LAGRLRLHRRCFAAAALLRCSPPLAAHLPSHACVPPPARVQQPPTARCARPCRHWPTRRRAHRRSPLCAVAGAFGFEVYGGSSSSRWQCCSPLAAQRTLTKDYGGGDDPSPCARCSSRSRVRSHVRSPPARPPAARPLARRSSRCFARSSLLDAHIKGL